MNTLSSSPIQAITFGQGLKVSLDNYYDLVKAQTGGLQQDEYLQLKLVSDSVDLSDKDFKDRGYRWFSYYNLLNRADRAIAPTPVEGTVQTAVANLTQVYENFLRKLRRFVVKKNLSQQEQLRLADIDVKVEHLRKKAMALSIEDRRTWREYAESMGYLVGDQAAYFQWSSAFGHLREIQQTMRETRDAEFDKKTILDRQYPEPSDRAVIDAEFAFENPAMRLRYPTFPDYDYDNGDRFNPTYLALLPLGSTALFDDRRLIAVDKTLAFIKTANAGSFSASFDRTTQEAKSIRTDWSASGSASYGFISVRASVSEAKQIQEEFNKARVVTAAAKSAMRVNLQFPTWFDPTLFTHIRVRENLHDFEEFFGAKGSLLYYPIGLVVVRGFSVTFDSAQAWTYDYARQFSASGGGGFSGFGVNFGGSASYSQNEKEHKVDVSNTKLTISDDDGTLRFIGYAVKKNTVFEKGIADLQKTAMGATIAKALNV